MIKAKPPCINCNDRATSCHGKCDKYKNYRTELEDEKRIIKKNKDQFSEIIGFKAVNKAKYAKRYLK